MTDYRSRDIPWLRIVQFHKEIVARAEQGFFSLNGRDDQAERWTSLGGFDPGTFAGPWNIRTEQINSQPFRLALEQRRHESIFLGGPCYVSRQRTQNNNYEPFWCALFYIEVELQKGENQFEIVPKQGVWNISPLIQDLLNHLEISTSGPQDELATRIMEKSAALQPNPSLLTQSIWRALEIEVPEVAKEIKRGNQRGVFPVQPSSWVLFTPAIRYSALTQHLNYDYERLEKLLTNDPQNRGGLRILEEQPYKVLTEHVDLLPLIPLNESQKHAVTTILQGHPLTVISGPPGTGKSQVVVALLLNAWAQGKSVLLASNNNKAVDVVRERLERFESDLPIAVRAGSRQKQNIQETLRRILNMRAVRRRSNDAMEPLKIRRRRQALIQEASGLKDYLKSEVPHRIDEAYKAALNAYGECRTVVDPIEQQDGQLRKELCDLGITNRPAEKIENDLVEIRKWLGRIEAYRLILQEDEQRHLEIMEQLDDALEARDAAARRFGFDTDNPSEDWDQLLLKSQLNVVIEHAEKRLLEALTQIREEIFQPAQWDDSYGKWSNETAAEEFASEIRVFSRQLQETLIKLEPEIRKLDEMDHELKEALENLQAVGGNSDVDVLPEWLDQWSTAFAEYVSLDRHLLDSSPWARRSQLQKEMKQLEQLFRPEFPLEVWLRIGSLDDNGRKQLAILIDRTSQWYKQREIWQQIQPLNEKVLDDLREVTRQAVALNVDEIPTGRELEPWKRIWSHCEQEAKSAEQAAIYWRDIKEKARAKANLQLLAEDWFRLTGTTPFSGAWRRTIGLEFDRLMGRLATNPTARGVNAARSALRNGVLHSLIDPWLEAQGFQKKIEVLLDMGRNTPTPEYRLREWWKEKPAEAFVLDECPSRWSDIPADFEILKQVSEWLWRWNNYMNVSRPAAAQEAWPHMTRALSRLNLVLDLLPAAEARNKVAKICDRIQGNLYYVWPLTELNNSISRFGALQTLGQVEQIEAEIERSAFTLAKSSWLERLRTDVEAIRGVDQLESTLSKNKGRLPSGNSDIFRAALRAAPIWITTAQAPQAVPLEPDLFDIVVIDEASQCTVTNLLPLVYRGKSLVVLGDDKQLPAIATIHAAEEETLSKKHQIEEFLYLIGHANNDVYHTAVQSLPGRRGDVLMLVEHFRSHPQIIGFSNRHIYLQQLELKKDPTREKQLPIASGVHKRPVQGYACRGANGRSWVNEAEAEMIISLISELKGNDKRSLSLGVVTPFAAQKEYLRARLDNSEFASDVLIDSAYGFQGDEKDIIIFSPVVARGVTPSASRWVESPPNLINVAITRAREALFVVADFDYCRQQEGLLRDLALYCDDIQLLRETSQAELELFSWMVLKGLTPYVHPRIGDIEVDFGLRSSSGKRLVIEVDGRRHDSRTEADNARDAFLNARGCTVLRFPAQDVFETPIAVLHTLQEHMRN